MGILDRIEEQQGKMRAARDSMQERAKTTGFGEKLQAWADSEQAKADAGHAKLAQTASGVFEGVAYRAGTLTVNRKSYPMVNCTMRVEQGADVHARGWTLTTGMIGSGKLKGHMRLIVSTPDGDQIVEFKADKASKAEDFVSKFTRTANLLEG